MGLALNVSLSWLGLRKDRTEDVREGYSSSAVSWRGDSSGVDIRLPRLPSRDVFFVLILLLANGNALFGVVLPELKAEVEDDSVVQQL